VTANGTLTLSTTSTQHPQIATSAINSSQDLSRYWTATKGGSLAIASYDLTLNFANGDLFGGASPSSFIMGKYDAGTGWTYPVVAVASANSTRANGITTGFSDFALGNQAVSGIDHFTVTPSTSSTSAGAVFTVTVQAYNASNQAINNNSVDGTSVTMTSSGLAQFDSNGDGTYGDLTKTLTNGTFTINVRDLKAESMTITALSATNTGTSTTVIILPAPAAQLQVLLPGETAAPGTALGKTGSPAAQVAGASFSVSINEVDTNWNIVSSTDIVALTAGGDANAFLPSNIALSSGTVTETVTNVLAGSAKSLTASDISGGSISANVSSSYIVVPGPASRMLLLTSGETQTFGVAPGKSGSPSAQHATVGYLVIVDALDTYYNLATNCSDLVEITSSFMGDTLPANATLVGGTKTFLLTNNTVGTVTLTATNVTRGTTVATGSSTVPVNINSTTTVLTSSANPANQGQSVTFTATVSGAGLKTGSVVFKNGPATLGSATILGNAATFTTSGGVGTYLINAAYSGDSNNLPSTSSVISQVIQTGGVAYSAEMEDGFDYALLGSSPGMPVGANVDNSPWSCSSDIALNTAVTGNELIIAGDIASTTSPLLKPLPNQSTNVPAHLWINRGATDREFFRSIGNAISSGSAYFSFMMSNSVAPSTAGAPMATMLASNVNDAPYGNDPLTLYGRAGIDSTHFNLGIQRLGGPISWASAGLAQGTAYILVLEYTFGGTCQLFINPTPGGSPPLADAVATGGTNAEPANIGTVMFYEAGSTYPLPSDGTWNYDVMRADSTWYNVTPPLGGGLGATFLAFNPASQIIQVNQNSTLITVSLLNQSNAAFNATVDTVVALTSTSGNGTFLSGADGTTVINSVVISNGTSAATFYYKDTSSGSPTITGASGLLTSAVQTEVITPNLSRLGHFTVTPSASATTAGTVFYATVQAYDTNNAPITDSSFDGTPVTLTSSGLAQFDANGDATYGDNIKSLANGTFTINVRDLKAEIVTLTAGLGTNTATSTGVNVSAGAFARLQLLLPGETAAPGTVSGRTNTPGAAIAGTAFTITVRAVDNYWNGVTANDMVHITQSGDANVILPPDTAMVGGTATFNVTDILVGSGQSLSASDISNVAIITDTSSPYSVISGLATQLILVAPGETPTFGAAPGKTGTPSDQLQTGSFSIKVYALDAYYNLALNSTDVVAITSSDNLAALPANASLVGGTKSFTLINKTQGTVTETASDTSITSVAPGSATLTIDPVQNFRSVQSGNWGDTNTWQYSSDGGNTWIPAIVTPSSALTAVVEVTNGTTVTVASSVTVNRTTVDSGAAISVSPGVSLTVVSGSGTDLDVFGIITNSGAITNISPATIAMHNGAVYYHNQDGGAIMPALWESNSTCAIIGWKVATAVTSGTGLKQNFGNFTWNSPNQTSTLSMGGSPPTNFMGNFNIVSTGSGVLALCLAASVNLNIGGDVNVTGGALYGATTGSGTETVNVAGNVNLSAGTFNLEADVAGTETVIWNLAGDLVITGGLLTAADTNVWPAVDFVKTGTEKLMVSGPGQIATLNTIDWAVASGATLDLETNTLQGIGTFVVNDGGGLITANSNGFKGSLLFQTNYIALSHAGNYTYDGSVGQSGDTLLPNIVSSLMINNNQGLILNQSETATNIYLNGSSLAGNISIGGAGAFTVAGNNSKVVGNVAMNFGSLILVSSNNLPELTVQAGALSLNGGSITLMVLGSPLPEGNYLLVDANLGGSVTGTTPNQATVTGNGLLPALYGSPQIAGGKLYFNVVAFYAGFDSGPGFFGGENLIFTNFSGGSFFVWSSANPSLPVINWNLEGQMSELPLGTSGYSRYGINVNPAGSPTYYVIGSTNGGPYLVSPVPVMTVTTSDYLNFTVIGTNAAITAGGILGLVPTPVVLNGQALAGGTFQLQFNGGESGQGYSIFASTNLTNWSLINTGTISSSPVTFTDTSATNYQIRFYRVSFP